MGTKGIMNLGLTDKPGKSHGQKAANLFSNFVATLKADVLDKDERASRLEMQLADTSSRADVLMQSFKDQVVRLGEEKKVVEGEKLKFLQLNSDLSADLERKRNELANVKMQLTLAEEKAAKVTTNYDKQAGEFRQLYDKYNMTKRRLLEAVKMKARIEALESENDRLQHEGSAKFRLSSDLQKWSEVERENTKLRNELKVIKERNENVEVLREKVSHLTQSLETAKADSSRLGAAETEISFLKEKLSFLGVTATGGVGPQAPSPESSSALGERIRLLEASAKADAGEIASLREALQVNQDTRKRLEEELEASKLRVAKLERQKYEETDAASQVRSQLVLCSSERDTFRSLLQMVERCLGFSGSPLSMQLSNVRVPTQLKELEAAFEAHKAEVNRMRNELLAAREKCEKSEEEIVELRKEVTAAQSALEAKTNDMAQLQFEHDQFAQRLEASMGSKPILDESEEEANRGKIVHFKANPADLAYRDWLTDEAVNLEQQRRAQRSGDSGSAVVDGITSAEVEDLRRRLNALERAIERKEKDLKATREMAAFSLKELQSAVTHLLGYELNLNAADKIYSLRSAYAEPAELFLFKPRHHPKSGAVSFQILETEMAQRFKESVQLYIIQHQSIPAFLASVTTDLFSKQTLMA